MDKPPKQPKTPRFEMRLPDELAERVDDWRRDRRPIPPRATAARELIERGLDADAEIARLRALLAADGRSDRTPEGVDADKSEGGTP